MDVSRHVLMLLVAITVFVTLGTLWLRMEETAQVYLENLFHNTFILSCMFVIS